MAKKKTKRTRTNYQELCERVKKELQIDKSITSMELISATLDVGLATILTLVKKYPEISSMLDYNRQFSKKARRDMGIEELFTAALAILETDTYIMFATTLAGALGVSYNRVKKLMQNEVMAAEINTLMNRNRYMVSSNGLKRLYRMDTLQATLLQIRLAEPRIGLLLGSLDTPVANDSQSKSSRIDELKKKYNNSSECD